ncbi:unnamed protein product [Effrenium voratum]|nr:unnamed protein product [Effrenium voratum]
MLSPWYHSLPSRIAFSTPSASASTASKPSTNIASGRGWAASAVCAYAVRRVSSRASAETPASREPSLARLLAFWFGDEMLSEPKRLNEVDYLRGRTKMWYSSNPQQDEAARRYVPLLRSEYEALSEAPLQSREEPKQLQNLARVVLFDQIPRNSFRGEAEAFYYDEAACKVSDALIESGFSDRCSAAELLSLVQPLVHAESSDASLGMLAIQILQQNMKRLPDEASKVLFQAILSHDAHCKVLRRFGRYPHRNAALGRESTQEELAWLESDAPGWARSQQAATDGTLHSKSFAHTDKGMPHPQRQYELAGETVLPGLRYFMGMTLMNFKSARNSAPAVEAEAPSNQPWVELRRDRSGRAAPSTALRHPGKLRWSQGCGILRLKVAESDGSRIGFEGMARTAAAPQRRQVFLPSFADSSAIRVAPGAMAAFGSVARLRRLMGHLRPSTAAAGSAGPSLGAAAKAGDVAKCRELLAAGAEVNWKDQAGRSALHWAAAAGHLELCRLLRHAGADIDARSICGETPLILAARAQKSLPTCDFLVAEGADMEARASKGARTAKEYLDDYLKELGVSVNCGLGSS